MTPVFPPDAKVLAMQVPKDVRKDDTEWQLEGFARICERDGVTNLYFDSQFVKLPKFRRKIRTEHVRGLGHDVWAATQPRIPGQMAP